MRVSLGKRQTKRDIIHTADVRQQALFTKPTPTPTPTPTPPPPKLYRFHSKSCRLNKKLSVGGEVFGRESSTFTWYLLRLPWFNMKITTSMCLLACFPESAGKTHLNTISNVPVPLLLYPQVKMLIAWISLINSVIKWYHNAVNSGKHPPWQHLRHQEKLAVLCFQIMQLRFLQLYVANSGWRTYF